jgi:ABC-type multidrug transport system fused ATPase/permease subunit
MQIALALFFLYQVLGASIFAGFLLMVILIPINGVIAKKMRGFQTVQMGIKDTRLKLLNEILNGIKVIKLYAWEESFLNKIEGVRNEELNTLRNASLVKAVTGFLWTSTPLLVSVVTFATYIAFGGILTAVKAFTAISLFNILRFPTNALPMVITSVAEASVSVDRLFTFLNMSELDLDAVSRLDEHSNEPFIEIEKGDFSWGAGAEEVSLDPAAKKDEDDKKEESSGSAQLTLSNINMRCRKGRLTAVIGKVGCGKSSLMSACLGEIPKVSGSVSMCGSVAYAPQQAWIQNATLRDNIVFGKPFVMKTYLNVIDACCLEQDIAMLPGGDLTEVGEKGITLSGGQKQRVSLARAVYQNADVYLLDDPLSAVDAHVGRHIFDNVVGPAGLLSDKVRVLVTHAEQYLPQCDSIFVMEKGTITMSGTYQQLVDQGHGFADTLAALKEEEEQQVEKLSESDPAPSPATKQKRERTSSLKFSNGAFVVVSEEGEEEKKEGDQSPPLEGVEETESAEFGKQFPEIAGNEKEKQQKRPRGSSALKGADETSKLIQTENRETGTVAWAVYWEYFKSLGVFNAFMIFFSFCLQQGFQILAQLWLTQWTAASADETTADRSGYYLGIYSALSIISSLGVLLRSVALLYGSLRSSRNLHSGMLENVCRAPMSFFDTTPLGRIVNRFSKDIYTVDEVLPNIIGMWLGSIFYTLSIIVILVIPLPYFIIVLIPVGCLFLYVQKFYLRSSREVQRLDSVSRSPIYAHFGETLNGVSTVRSYGREDDFIVHNHEMIDENQKAYFINVSSNRWLAVRLETVGTAIVSFAALFSVISTELWWKPEKADIHASLVGLAISSSLSMTQVLNWAVRMNCQMETNIVSVERVKEYTEIEREAPPISDTRPPRNWPSKGEISFNDVKLRYREGLDLVLKGVSINVGKHEKIGIVGRTGAGKSTVTLGLFRIVELAGGAIFIDGMDISKLGLDDLRKKLSIIPQDPVLFSGTLRENLDPFQQYNDEDIYEALTRSHLIDFVNSEQDGILMSISENGENLSVGQRQLVCMARALLRKSPILVMDEATAAVDYQTDALIQETIRSEFKDCTVLTIAHRLNTIMDSDRILVLGAGRVLELDTPQNLMANSRSHLARMVADANKAQQM